MSDIQHEALGYAENHVAHAYEYANASQREGDTGFVSGDIGKLALQLDDKSLWMLTATTPIWAAAILTGTISVDTITEDTLNAGVTVDGVLCKDNSVTASSGFVGDLTGDSTGDLTGEVVMTGDTTGSSAAGGDIATGTITYSKVGNVVTVSWSTLTHTLNNPVQTAVIIPAAYRPATTFTNMYLMDAEGFNQVTMSTGGSITFNYRDYTGNQINTTGTGPGSISYII